MVWEVKRSKQRAWEDREEGTEKKNKNKSRRASRVTTATKTTDVTSARTSKTPRAAGPSPLEDQAREFLLHEYDAHARYLTKLYGRLGLNLQLGVLVTAVYWGWIIAWRLPTFVDSSSWVSWLPFIVATVLLGQSIATNTEISRLVKYGTQVETKFNLPSRTGYYKNATRFGPSLPLALLTLVWFILVVINLTAPWWVRREFNQIRQHEAESRSSSVEDPLLKDLV